MNSATNEVIGKDSLLNSRYSYIDYSNVAKYGYESNIKSGRYIHKNTKGPCPDTKDKKMIQNYEDDYICNPYEYYTSLIDKRNASCACKLARETALIRHGGDLKHERPYIFSNLYCGMCERQIRKLADSLLNVQKLFNEKRYPTVYTLEELLDLHIMESNLKQQILMESLDEKQGYVNHRRLNFIINSIISQLRPMNNQTINSIDANIRDYVKKNPRDKFAKIYRTYMNV